MVKENNIFGDEKMIKSLRNKKITIGNFGIEIECYDVDQHLLKAKLIDLGVSVESEFYNHDDKPHWKIVYDGSVSGPGACEVVSPILNGQNGIDQIKKVTQALDYVGAKINPSCGLHVHHEAKDFDNKKKLMKVVSVYQRMEKFIDDFMPISRRGNNTFYAKTMIGVTDNVAENHGGRYYKVNLQSWYRQGTVEFRQHSGTVEADKIINWVYFTALVMDRARGRVLVNTPLKRWVDVKWFLGVTTDKIDQEFTSMVKFYENRSQSFRMAA